MSKPAKNYQKIMPSEIIDNLNSAVLAVRQLSEISDRLLPTLDKLNKKEFLNSKDKVIKEKILQIFDQHGVSSEFSLALINSPIINLVECVKEKLIQEDDASFELKLFREEFQRLQKKWQIIEAN